MQIDTMAVIGAGAMGSGIAHVFALSGRRVLMFDTNQAALEDGVAAIRNNLDRQIRKERIAAEEGSKALARITTGTQFENSLASADLVVEAVTEQKEVKAAVLRQASAGMKADAILASNTSSISITWLGAQTGKAERFIGMHFFNPVPVMKLVEVVRGLETSEDTYKAICAVAREIGKTPIGVQDFPGFVSNRILMPMINEAIYCRMEGVASAEDIDTVMKLGMAHPMGPLALADFIGLDVCLDIMEVLQRELGEDKYRPCPLLRKMVAAGQLGRKAGRGFYSYQS